MEYTALYKTLYDQIDNILWYEWDPIGVNEYKEARDEYQSYVPQLVNLKLQGASMEEIASLLHKIETQSMGLQRGDEEKCRKVAVIIGNLGI